jgi:hypothetical protein
MSTQYRLVQRLLSQPAHASSEPVAPQIKKKTYNKNKGRSA